MKLYTRVKALGKRRPVMQLQPIVLSQVGTLRSLLTELVTLNVAEFNQKPTDQLIFHYLLEEELDAAAEAGKVGFGGKYQRNEQNLELAIENAIQSFTDGIYLVLVNDQEIKELDTPLDLEEEDILTFIKLTMLSGRMW